MATALDGTVPIDMLVTASGDYCIPDSTDDDGSFAVTNVEGGDKRLITYGETASNGLFASIVLPISVEGDLVLANPVASPLLAESYPVATDADDAQVIETDDGLTLEIPVDAIEFAPFMPEEVQVSRIPLESTPAFVPAGVELADLFVLHPIRSTIDPPASVRFPPVTGAVPGTEVRFHALDYETGWLVEVARGTVDDDGRPVSAAGEGIPELTWIAVSLWP